MAVKQLKVEQVELPVFTYRLPAKSVAENLSLFHLSSHAHARDAIEFGLKLPFGQGNIFVVGGDRTGRMDSTYSFVRNFYASKPRPDDWIYLNNFNKPHAPKPYHLPPGTARGFKERMRKVVTKISDVLPKLLSSKEYAKELEELYHEEEKYYEQELTQLKYLAKVYRMDVQIDEKGGAELVFVGDGESDPAAFYQNLSQEEQDHVQEGMDSLRPRVWRLSAKIQEARHLTNEKTSEIQRAMADEAFSDLFDALERDYGHVHGLLRWLITMRTDVLENLDAFLPLDPSEHQHPFGELKKRVNVFERYAVNVFVDRSDEDGCPVILVSNPTYENMFGSIKYKSTPQGYDTDFTLVHPGAVHRANGGVLIVRAEDIASNDKVWMKLKSVIRDQKIVVDEPYRAGGMPVLESPEPEEIPLEIKVIIVGAHRWYRAFFYADPSFKTYFRIKADIDENMPANSKNLGCFAALAEKYAKDKLGFVVTSEAMQALLGVCARISGNRNKLSSRFEIIESILSEAVIFAKRMGAQKLLPQDIMNAFNARLDRDRHHESFYLESFKTGSMILDTTGKRVGQINGLTVLTTNAAQFGLPSRITATTYCGKSGIINIERQTDMAGPIQQKGVFTLEGYLHDTFGQEFPISFGSTLTFEQLYSEIDGDSASMAELCALLSALSDVPLRQDLAITGSVDQKGRIQVIGGVNEKIEGFFNVCKDRGFKGASGVVVPKANMQNLCLREDICDAIKKGQFSIYSLDTVKEVMELFTGEKFGSLRQKESILGKSFAKLKKWYDISAE